MISFTFSTKGEIEIYNSFINPKIALFSVQIRDQLSGRLKRCYNVTGIFSSIMYLTFSFSLIRYHLFISSLSSVSFVEILLISKPSRLDWGAKEKKAWWTIIIPFTQDRWLCCSANCFLGYNNHIFDSKAENTLHNFCVIISKEFFFCF